MKTYSLDLREKMMEAIKRGDLSRHALARIFGVSYGWIKKLDRQLRKLGHFAPLPHGGGQKPLLDDAKLAQLRQKVLEKPDATLEELRQKIKIPGQPAPSPPTVCRALKHLGLVRKKKVLIASEQNPTERADYQEIVEGLREDARRLIFVDETGCNIDFVRRYGRAPKGERVVDRVPRNTPANLSLVCAMAPEGMIASMEIEGAVDGVAFGQFVEHFLVPELRAGDIVIMDNLSTHTSEEKVAAPIEAKGAFVLYLPAYSPDLNPIEECFSKFKSILRSIGARTRRKLCNAICKALAAITPENIKSWFEHAGYWVTAA